MWVTTTETHGKDAMTLVTLFLIRQEMTTTLMWTIEDEHNVFGYDDDDVKKARDDEEARVTRSCANRANPRREKYFLITRLELRVVNIVGFAFFSYLPFASLDLNLLQQRSLKKQQTNKQTNKQHNEVKWNIIVDGFLKDIKMICFNLLM